MPQIRRCRYQGCHGIAFVPNYYCQKHIKEQQKLDKQNNEFKNHRYSNPAHTRYYNKVTRYRNKTKARQNHFYHSKAWKSIRNVVLSRDYHLCQYCKALGITKEGNVVDHVKPVEVFPADMKNIQNMVTCCGACHYWKTRWEEKYYGTGLHGKPTGNTAVTDVKLIAKLFNALKDTKKGL